ncbi:hypothetical protein LIER_13883 [Lithospermum erythrorhizon]|uniref:Putative plant transposon protein domain-containing protein n=1 Tax=Lithospermum erythrorhizon TaxID=34254 RepID=A0AAV3PY00_LITER
MMLMFWLCPRLLIGGELGLRIALEKKKDALGVGGDSVDSTEAVEVMDLEGVLFSSEENEARWNFVCSRNILSERYLSDATMKNQTYMDILDESGLSALVEDIGPHWSFIVREFICNLSKDIIDPSSPMFHKVKLRGLVFNFSPALINDHYGWKNDGITGSNLKLNDIIKTLTGGALIEWPTKGQLQASVLSLRYAVIHKVEIANLEPTSNNTNVSETVGRMLYVMGTEQELNFCRVIFNQIVDHSRIGMTGKRVVDVEIKDVEPSDVVPEGEAAALLIKAYEEEQQRVEAKIQLKKGRVAELQVKIQALKTTVPLAINDPVPDDIAEPDAIPPTVNDPPSDGADNPDETESHV